MEESKNLSIPTEMDALAVENESWKKQQLKRYFKMC